MCRHICRHVPTHVSIMGLWVLLPEGAKFCPHDFGSLSPKHLIKSLSGRCIFCSTCIYSSHGGPRNTEIFGFYYEMLLVYINVQFGISCNQLLLCNTNRVWSKNSRYCCHKRGYYCVMWIECGWRDISTLEGFSLHSVLVYFLYFLNKTFLNLNLNLNLNLAVTLAGWCTVNSSPHDMSPPDTAYSRFVIICLDLPCHCDFSVRLNMGCRQI